MHLGFSKNDGLGGPAAVWGKEGEGYIGSFGAQSGMDKSLSGFTSIAGLQ